MCKFFSFLTEPENHGGQRFYFDWKYRKNHLRGDNYDSHSTLAKVFGLKEDICNKYEYNPLTKSFEIDQINSEINDSVTAENWVNQLDFSKVVEPLIIKPIINPLELPEVKTVSEEQIKLLRVWASVRASVRASVGASVWASVWDSVRASVGASVGDSVRAYISTFFNIQYEPDFSSGNKLWESGLVPSFDGKTWRLHTGKNAKIVYEISNEELMKTK